MSYWFGLWVVVMGCATFAGCGDEAAPKPDQEQLRVLVGDFFANAAADNAEAVCAALTPDGRARALLRRFVGGRPIRPASQAQCVGDKAPWALDSTDLPHAMDNGYRVRVPSVRVRGTAAVATVRFTVNVGGTDQGHAEADFENLVNRIEADLGRTLTDSEVNRLWAANEQAELRGEDDVDAGGALYDLDSRRAARRTWQSASACPSSGSRRRA